MTYLDGMNVHRDFEDCVRAAGRAWPDLDLIDRRLDVADAIKRAEAYRLRQPWGDSPRAAPARSDSGENSG